MTESVITAIAGAIAGALAGLLAALPGILDWRRQMVADREDRRTEKRRLQQDIETEIWERTSAELASMRAEITQLRTRVHSLEVDNLRLRLENETLQGKLKTAEGEIHLQARQIEALEAKNRHLQDQMDGLSTNGGAVAPGLKNKGD